MAILNANSAHNMLDQSIWFGMLFRTPSEEPDWYFFEFGGGTNPPIDTRYYIEYGSLSSDGGIGEDFAFEGELIGFERATSGGNQILLEVSEFSIQISESIFNLAEGAIFQLYPDILSGEDTLNGSQFDDVLSGFAGNDIIDGGPGIDTAVYSDNQSSYSLTLSGLLPVSWTRR